MVWLLILCLVILKFDKEHTDHTGCGLQMYEKFEFPLEVQRWIVRKRLVSDKETISSTRVKNNEELYLYLVPARNVGVTKESAQASYLGIPRQGLSSLLCFSFLT